MPQAKGSPGRELTAERLELLAIGRVSVDLYPQQSGVPLRDVVSFAKSLGGSPANVAVAAARLGRRAAVVTRVGDDDFGVYIRRTLAERFGVVSDYVSVDPELRTAIVFCALDPPENPPLLFYREPRGPDMNLTVDDVPLSEVDTVPVLWVAGSRFAQEPSRSAVMAVLERRGRADHTVLDLDYRSSFWRSPGDASEHIGAAVDHATVALGNRAECEIAVGTGEPHAAADRLLERGVKLAIVKKGGDGVLVATESGRSSVPPLRVEVVCGLGAGDAFGGALVDGLLAGSDPVSAVERANAAGAIVAGRLACADAMPTSDEIDEMLAGAAAWPNARRDRMSRGVA